MKHLVGLCLFALAVPVFVGDPGTPDPAFESLTSWEGKHSDELIAEWGKPRKTKRDGKDGKVLIYRLRFLGKEIVGGTLTNWLESDGTHVAGSHPGEFLGQPEVIATQKVKFYVDAEGIVRGQESARRKWKQKKP